MSLVPMGGSVQGYAPQTSLLGTIGGVIGGIGGFIAGGPGGAVAGATAGRNIGDAINGPQGGPQTPVPTGGSTAGMGVFGFTGGQTTPSPGPSSNGTGCGCKSGCKGDTCSSMYGCGSRLNKHWLAPTKGGCGRVAHGWQAPGTWCVKRRHMNPLNIKALRRADRRAHSFLRISKKLVKHFVAKQPKGRGYIKARKRSR